MWPPCGEPAGGPDFLASQAGQIHEPAGESRQQPGGGGVPTPVTTVRVPGCGEARPAPPGTGGAGGGRVVLPGREAAKACGSVWRGPGGEVLVPAQAAVQGDGV